ncbi:MAG: DUF885 domain-containing protein [Actinomycetia bacterium]|nr:DUF885 domain-containing protein [Actinomycetes bacterium]
MSVEAEQQAEAFRLADSAVERLIALDPCTATELGVIDPAGRLTDFSPAGIEQRRIAVQEILEQVAQTRYPADQTAGITMAVMSERLGNLVDMAAAGDYLNDLNILASPPHAIRMALELLPPDTATATVIGRLNAVPAALSGWRESLELGVANGIPAAQRQALAVAEQLATFSSDWIPQFVSARSGEEADPALLAAAERASAAFADSATWLRDVYEQSARRSDAVGAQTYARKARAWLGDDLDLAETYAWGWQELARVSKELRETAAEILPGVPIGEVKESLDQNPDYQLQGVPALTEYLSELTISATDDLDGAVFDIPAAVRRCDVKIAPQGAAAAPYYVPPSEDLSRPGSTWYPTRGKTEFPRWWLVGVWYHEGVPGHHLQFGMAAVNTDNLSRFQRTFGWTAGHAEGWALYAERLMAELGYLSDPALRFGMLSAQVMRAARVVLDIGMHLELAVPEGHPRAGQVVDAAFARRMLVEEAMLEPEFAASEVDRYLGLPGQAIAYKVGERDWFALRAQAQEHLGPAFDLKDWHTFALSHGPMGLGPFRSLMQRHYA